MAEQYNIGGKYDISLEYIKTTDNIKTVCLNLSSYINNNVSSERKVYILNQEKGALDNEFNQEKSGNKTAFELMLSTDMSATHVLEHNLYNTKNMFYKSAIYAKSKSNRTGTTYDFKNIFSHNLSTALHDTIQVNNTLYAIDGLSPLGHIDINEDSYQFLIQDNNNIVLPDKIIETYLYNISAVSALVSEDNPDKSQISNVILSTLKDINYNTIFEIPGSIQNEFDSGNIAANSFKGKNQYDSLFNMNHTPLSGDNLSPDLSNAREYIKIDNCNNQVYLKYYDNLTYQVKPETIQNNTAYLTSSISSVLRFPGQKLQNIETIDYIGRYANQNGHKSNLYSIAINTDIFDDIPKTEQNDLSIIKYEIKNIVKSIVQKLAPAHTQLFKITIQGE